MYIQVFNFSLFGGVDFPCLFKNNPEIFLHLFENLCMEKYPNVNWPEAIKPLLKKYKNEKHPLAYKNTYQLIVMVVLSAQDSDRHINKIAPKLFEAFPNMASLSETTAKIYRPM